MDSNQAGDKAAQPSGQQATRPNAKLVATKVKQPNQASDKTTRPSGQQATGPDAELATTKAKQPNEVQTELAAEAKPDYAQLEAKIQDLEERLELAESGCRYATWNLQNEQEWNVKRMERRTDEEHVAEALGPFGNRFTADPKPIWQALMGHVRAVATQFPIQVEWDDIDAATQQELLEFAPMAPKYLASKYDSQAVWLAWIYHLLYSNLLGPHCGPKHAKWPTPEWKAYAVIRDRVSCLADETNSTNTVRFHLWRFLTTRLIGTVQNGGLDRSSAWHTDGAYLEKILLRKFEPILHMSIGLTPFVLSEIHFIVEYAVSFDHHCQLSKIDFDVIMTDPATDETFGFPFAPSDDMRADIVYPAKAGETVEMVTHPLITERGKESGYHYDQVETAWPMEVTAGRYQNGANGQAFFEVPPVIKDMPHAEQGVKRGRDEDEDMDVDMAGDGDADKPSAN